jgi:Conserved TM helix
MHVLPTLFSPVLAQTTTPTSEITTQWQGLQNDLIRILPSLLGALAVFIVGVIIAAALASLTRSLLRRTNLDNRLAASILGDSRTRPAHTEKLFGSIVFWVITILAAVAALNVLNLNTVSQPLNTFLGEIFRFLPRLGSAIVLGLVAWVVATLTKLIVVRSARSFRLDERFSDQSQITPRSTDEPLREEQPGTQTYRSESIQDSEENRFSLSETLGNALYWFVFLFFLPLILGVLDLQGPLQPVQNLLNEILAALPRILKAVLIGAAGWIIARVVQGIVSNLLSASGADRLGRRFGLSRTTGSRSLSWLLGTIVFVLILIPTAIAALDALQIQAISAPATSMLNQILNTIPQIFTAALILLAGYVVGKFIADLVTNVLRSLGFDSLFSWLGLRRTAMGTRQPGAPMESPQQVTPDGTTIPQPTSQPTMTIRTPSEVLGIVSWVGIILFATVAATNVLNIPALTAIVTGLLVVFGRILVGLLIFAVGLYLANLAYSLIASSGGYQARILGQIARVAIIGLVSAMALQQMGIAPDIVNLAFGLLLGAIAVATAIAFGLGGREIASEQTRRWLNSFQGEVNGQRRREESTYR